MTPLPFDSSQFWSPGSAETDESLPFDQFSPPEARDSNHESQLWPPCVVTWMLDSVTRPSELS